MVTPPSPMWNFSTIRQFLTYDSSPNMNLTRSKAAMELEITCLCLLLPSSITFSHFQNYFLLLQKNGVLAKSLISSLQSFIQKLQAANR